MKFLFQKFRIFFAPDIYFVLLYLKVMLVIIYIFK
nr:MAG TPA: hypothetical protein [Caudoviricetes sp.]